jgi:HSF-type DNA-binding
MNPVNSYQTSKIQKDEDEHKQMSRSQSLSTGSISSNDTMKKFLQSDSQDAPGMTVGTLIPHNINIAHQKRSFSTFPMRLHHLLQHASRNGIDHIISWQDHGRSFHIHRKDDFVRLVMPT